MLKQKEPTKPLQERIVEIGKMMGSLGWMKGYPQEERHIAMICRCIANFAQTVGVQRVPENPDDPAPDADGWVYPAAWLFDRIGETCEWFPKPIQMRRIYETKFHPLDGKNSVDMESVIGE